MIVAPQFSDQFDNAQRLVETGLGARIDPYHFSGEELTATIDRLLSDPKVGQKLQAASERLQGRVAKQHELLADKIEQMLSLEK